MDLSLIENHLNQWKEEEKEETKESAGDIINSCILKGHKTSFLVNLDSFNKKIYQHVKNESELTQASLEMECREIVRHVLTKWSFEEIDKMNEIDYFNLLIERSGIRESEDILKKVLKAKEEISMDENNILFRIEIFSFYEINHAMRAILFLEDEEEKLKLERDLKILHDFLYHLFSAYKCIRIASYVGNDLSVDSIDLFKFIGDRFLKKIVDQRDPGNFPILLEYIESQMVSHGFRRFKEDVYSPVYTKDGMFTHSWVRECSLRYFISKVCARECNEYMFRLSESSPTMALNLEKRCLESQSLVMQELKMSRYAFAFANGIYHINVLSDLDYNRENEMLCEEERLDTERQIVVDRFYEYGSEEFKKKITTDIVCCKYFNINFEYIETKWPEIGSGIRRDDSRFGTKDYWSVHTWFDDIPTPHFQKIPGYQFKDEEEEKDGKYMISKFYYFIHGRLFYNTGSHDNNQLIPFTLGEANTGKSTTGDVIRMFYPHEKVGIIGNRFENRFGLEAIHDKFINIGMDVNSKLSLDQTSLQSMASGEPIQIEPKGKKSYNIPWNPSTCLYGNELPGQYYAMGGAIPRRFVLHYFRNKLIGKQIDDNLHKKLKKELPFILQKMIRSYLFTRILYIGDNFWNYCPNYYWNNRNNLESRTNSLLTFMKSEYLMYGKHHCCPFIIFEKRYQDFCKATRNLTLKLNEDTYLSPFSTVSKEKVEVLEGVKIVVVESGNYIYPTPHNPTTNNHNAQSRTGKFIVGLDINETAIQNLRD